MDGSDIVLLCCTFKDFLLELDCSPEGQVPACKALLIARSSCSMMVTVHDMPTVLGWFSFLHGKLLYFSTISISGLPNTPVRLYTRRLHYLLGNARANRGNKERKKERKKKENEHRAL